jgi:HNH endonuclease
VIGEASTSWVWPEPVPDERAVPLPPGLAEMPPGSDLSVVLAGVDRTRLTGHDLVTLLEAWSSQVAHDQAQMHAVVAEVAHSTEPDTTDRSDVVVDYAADEIRAALRITRRAADTTLNLALGLQRLPSMWEALASGAIDLPRARVLCDATIHLDERTAQQVVDVVLPAAGGLTTGQLAARVRRVTFGLDPTDATRRYETAVQQRHLVLHQGGDGTAELVASCLPADKAVAAMRYVNRLAHQLKREGDPRSIDQLRVDITLDLMTGNRPSVEGNRQCNAGVVEITVDLATLVGLSDTPGELNGYGPVVADVARQITNRQPNSQWRVTITHPDSGDVLWNGVTKRRPNNTLRRQIEARSPTCVFPGCRMPAADCDLDHTIDHAHGGPTTDENLGPLCRHDHMVKHHGRWKLRRTPNGYTWTSPLGHTYHTSTDPPP